MSRDSVSRSVVPFVFIFILPDSNRFGYAVLKNKFVVALFFISEYCIHICAYNKKSLLYLEIGLKNY